MMTWKLLLTLSSFACLAAIARPARAADDFEAVVFHDGDQSLPYRLLKPLDYSPAKKYPLMLFLHGAGERGTDNQKQLIHFTKIFTTAENRQKYPCFVVAPQCPQGQQWVDVPWGADRHSMPPQPSRSMALALKLVAQLQKDYAIDPQRLYVAGLSMGGYGTWDAISRCPNLFAAAVPICGGADEEQAAAVAKIPVWVFHGEKDTAVKTIRSRNMVEAMKKAGGAPKYTEYPGLGHGSWGPASKEPELLPWLFAQKRK